jgi:hypothetical protein
VTTFAGWSSPVPVTVTVTPGSTPPVASVTFPKIVPVVAWAQAVPADNVTRPAQRTAHLKTLAIYPPQTYFRTIPPELTGTSD